MKDYYIYSIKNHFFLYNNKNQKIYFISSSIKNVLENKIECTLSQKESLVMQEILKSQKIHTPIYSEDVLYISINNSTKCNFNCQYCFRNKDNKEELSEKEIEGIVAKLIGVYKDKYRSFVFVLGLTTEPLLYQEKIRNLKKILNQYDNYLFSEDDFIGITPSELYSLLPLNIKKKYKAINNSDYIFLLNTIIRKESLNKYYKLEKKDLYDGFGYLFDAKKLNTYELTLFNRKILENRYWGKIKEKLPVFCTLSFTTNASCIDGKSISLIKEIGLSEINVSCDGPEEIHNYNRIYPNNKGTFQDTIRGIKLLQKRNFKINISCVLNLENSDIIRIVKFFKSLKIHRLTFGLIRPLDKNEKTLDKLKRLLETFDSLYNYLYQELEKGDSSTVEMLNDSFVIIPLKALIQKKHFYYRCGWGRNIHIDNKGNIYPCLYFFSNEDFCYGHYSDYDTYTRINDSFIVDEIPGCNECWARYLCTGTCPYLSYNSNNDIHTIDDIDCFYRKEIIKKALRFYTTLQFSGLLPILERIL